MAGLATQGRQWTQARASERFPPKPGRPASLTMRLVVDSSVLIAAVRPNEAEHASALEFVERLRAAQAAGAASAFGPPELWLEVHVVEQRFAKSRHGGPAIGN